MKNTDAVVYENNYILMQSISNQNIDNEIHLCLSSSDVDVYIIDCNFIACNSIEYNSNEYSSIECNGKYLVFALRENNRKSLEPYKKL